MRGDENQIFLGIKRLSAIKYIISRKEDFNGIIKTKRLASTTEVVTGPGGYH